MVLVSKLVELPLIFYGRRSMSRIHTVRAVTPNEPVAAFRWAFNWAYRSVSACPPQLLVALESPVTPLSDVPVSRQFALSIPDLASFSLHRRRSKK